MFTPETPQTVVIGRVQTGQPHQRKLFGTAPLELAGRPEAMEKGMADRNRERWAVPYSSDSTHHHPVQKPTKSFETVSAAPPYRLLHLPTINPRETPRLIFGRAGDGREAFPASVVQNPERAGRKREQQQCAGNHGGRLRHRRRRISDQQFLGSLAVGIGI